MKKLFLSLVFVALSAMTFAQQWTSISKSNPAGPEVSLVSSSEQKVVVDFTLGGFELTRVSTPNGIQQIVSVPKMASMLEAGAPDLPHFPIPAIIGDRAEMQVNVVKSEYIDYENVEIAPSKGNFSRQINPDDVPYTYGAMYSQNAFYPVAQATLEAPYILRDFRGQNIMVAPFAYNPVTKTLRVYHHLTIAMNKVSDNGVNQKVTRKAAAKVSPETQAAYSSRFINYKQNGAKYNFVTDRGEMLVICPDQYMEAMQPFVNWKNQSGRPTTMVSLADAGGNNDNAIKSYISNIYNDPEHNLVYVLLVGDYADLTPHSMSGGRSDNWFGQLEGNDYYLELFTGRFSANSVTDVETQVEKVIYYERFLDDKDTWMNTGIGIGANEGAGSGHNGGEADYVHMNYIRDTLMHYTYETVTQQYSGIGSGTSAAAISADVNAGASIINYCNHGSQTSWAVANYSNSHVNALVNDDKWPFVWSVACNNGQFDGTCFGEAWLRATNNETGRPTGAVGGMFSWISQPWVPPMTGQDEMVDILTEWKSSDQYCHTFGGASLNGSMYMLDMHPSDNGATHNTWILFGDPSLMVRTDVPANMNLSVDPPILMLGMSELEITAEASYGIATLIMDDEVLAIGDIIDGSCTLVFPPMTEVGIATLTVMGYNMATEVIDVMVNPAEGPYITVSGYEPGFTPVNQETSLSISFKNVGVDPTPDVTTVTLSCGDSRLEIINGTAEFDVLDADEIVTLTDAFSFILAEGVEDGARFQIDVTMTCGGEVWTGKAIVTAYQAILSFIGMDWDGGFIPGQTLTLATTFQNVGHYMATNAIATITCESEFVNIVNDTFEVGTIDPEGLAVSLFEIVIEEACPETEQIVVNFALNADGGLIAEGSATLKNTCNVVFDLVDSYGDGWNGNKLVVSFDDGTPSQQLTIQTGNHETYTLEIGNGVHVTLGWITGNYTSECSFSVSYENGDEITSASNLNANYSFEFDCNCAVTPIVGGFSPVANLAIIVDVESITLTWDAPEDALNYTVMRNGVEIGETEDTTFVDEVSQEATYTYCVIANYRRGSSLPECVVTEAEWGIEENEATFSIYPNPVSGTLYVNGGSADYSYEMFNGMGQMVATGNGQGTMEINVNGMAKGVYFLRLTSGTQVRMEKVVVE